MALDVRLQSTSTREKREVHVQGIVVRLETTRRGRRSPGPVGDRGARRRGPPGARPAQEGRFPLRVALPPDFPSGDFEASVAFDQSSAVKFYPPEASFTFHVPSFRERYGLALGGGGAALASGVVGLVSTAGVPFP